MQRIVPNVLRYGLVTDPSVSDGEAAAVGATRELLSRARQPLTPHELPVVRVAHQLRVHRHPQLLDSRVEGCTEAVAGGRGDGAHGTRCVGWAQIVLGGARPLLDHAAVWVVRRPAARALVHEGEHEHLAGAAHWRRADCEKRRRRAVEGRKRRPRLRLSHARNVSCGLRQLEKPPREQPRQERLSDGRQRRQA